MSFKAKLQVEGKNYNVLQVQYGLNQLTDVTGRPSAITRGGLIALTVESTADSFLFEWMSNNFERKNGSLVFVKRDADATLKELKFEEAYIVRYGESFDAIGKYALLESITISAKNIKMGYGEHLNDWK